jgi:cysteine desulfurase
MDHGAARPLDPRVLEEMKPYFSDKYGNPSSFHGKGFDAQRAMKGARERVASLIGAEASEIIFTSSATESNNLGIFGAMRRYKKKGNRIVISKIEHISIMNIVKGLKREGFETEYIPVDAQGIIQLEALDELINDETILVSVMAANGEIGTIQPIKKVSDAAHEHDALFHTDATAAAGQIMIDISDTGIDLMSLSSNDLYGPKGVGALYMRKGLRVRPMMLGGGQEDGVRSGSENIPGMVGMGKAAELAKEKMAAESERLRGLRDTLIKGLIETIPESYLNGHPTERLPNNAPGPAGNPGLLWISLHR